MVMCWLRPVALSVALTLRMPSASMSKVTSICGTPRGAGGMPSRMNLPSDLLSAAIGRSPCTTWISTSRWLSEAVEKIWLLRVGIGRVALDQRRGHAAQRLDRQRQRRHVQQQDVLDLAAQHAGLDRRADRHHLVRVDALVRLAAEDLAHRILHRRHARHAADQHHLVDVGRAQAGVLQRLAARADRALDQIVGQLLQLGARQASCSGAWGRWRRR